MAFSEEEIRYVHLAIADYLGLAGKKSSTMSLSGMSTKFASLVKNRFHLSVVFPFSTGISIEGLALVSNISNDLATTDSPIRSVDSKTRQELPRASPIVEVGCSRFDYACGIGLAATSVWRFPQAGL